MRLLHAGEFQRGSRAPRFQQDANGVKITLLEAEKRADDDLIARGVFVAWVPGRGASTDAFRFWVEGLLARWDWVETDYE